MSEKLFSRLFWRPYIFIGISMILVLLSSMVPYILPHAWLGQHYPGYDFYMFKGMAWTLKLALLIYLYGIVCIFTKNYFPKLSNLCTEEVRAVITGYKSSWSRGKQLCPVFTYKVGDKEYSEALNEAKGTKEKSGDVLERGFTLKLPRKIIYNPQNPKEFYLPGCGFPLYFVQHAAFFAAVSELFCECEVDYEQNWFVGFTCPFR